MAKAKKGEVQESKSGALELGVYVGPHQNQLYRSYSVEVHGDKMEEYAESVAAREGGVVKKIR